MAHVPLRGMVRKRVLEVFAGMYRAGGADFDFSGKAGPAGDAIGEERPDTAAAASTLLEKIAMWYVNRRQRR
jgi:hypothetical protein